MERENSPAFEVLRPSSRRLLAYIEQEIERQGGNAATLFMDQLKGRYVPAMSELHMLGFFEVVRLTKRYDCRLSSRWRDVRSMHDAMAISGAARIGGCRCCRCRRNRQRLRPMHD